MSLVTLVRTAPVTPRAFCLFMPLEVHAHHYKGIAEGIKNPSIPKKGVFFLPLLPDPVVKTYWLKVKHMPWAFLRDQTLIYFVASEKQAAGSDTAKLSHYSQGAGDPRETFPSHSSIHFHSFSTDLQMNGRTKHHARARQQKILLSVMLVDHCFKILAIILSFWWHFC